MKKNLIPKSFIQDVVARTDIVSVIQSRIELKKRGGTHTACCPFHNEKTPSFSVSQAKQFYYCFGCGAHGNVIGFLMEYDHLSFVDAVTDLANQLGMPIPVEASELASENYDHLYALLRSAQSLYEAELKKSQPAITYLKNRGLTGQIAKTFGVGYAPDAWEFVARGLGKTKSDRESLALAGLTIEKGADHYYDRFRDRVIFPIRDTRGRTIAFGGRTMTNETPKYLNSPETPVFHKNQTLYGLYEMCQQHRKLTRVLVVEGYLDVISLAQHGVFNAVATLGTALNIKHIQILLRYTSDIIFCFDGDNAGRKAAWKALTISLPLLRDGLNFRFLFLPTGDDPDSLIRRIGCDAFESLMNKAETLSTVFFDELAKEFPMDTIAGKAAFAKQATDYLNTMPQGIYKNLLLDQLSARMNMARDRLMPEKPVMMVPKKTIRSRSSVRLSPAESAMQLLLHQPALATTVNMPSIATHQFTNEKKMLLDLLNRCKQNPHLQVSELLSEIEDAQLREMIASIASYPLHIPAEGYAAELAGALQLLYEQDQSHELSRLIDKAKNTELNSEEKQLLQLLLAKKHTTKSVA
jgi:DNA primase